MNMMKTIKFAAAGVLLSGTVAMAATIDLNTPEGAIEAERKIYCSSTDEKITRYMFDGYLYGRKRGEADKLLFRTTGMTVRQCVTVEDEKRGKGYKLITREIMLYRDPVTGEVLDKWENPYLGREVDVMHVSNDPVNQRPSFPNDANGNPSKKWIGRQINDSWIINLTVPLFYQNPMQGDYQKYVGGAYHATEMFSFFGKMDDITDGDKDVANVDISWTRLSEWLPWMEMQGREGLIYVNAIGKLLNSHDELPQVLKDYIKNVEPKYMTPPPVDDTRPNATTWTVFKGRTEPERLPFGGHN